MSLDPAAVAAADVAMGGHPVGRGPDRCIAAAAATAAALRRAAA